MRGRPKRQVAARLPDELIEQLEAIARAENNSLSAVTRRLLTVAVKHEHAPSRDTPIPKNRRAS